MKRLLGVILLIVIAIENYSQIVNVGVENPAYYSHRLPMWNNANINNCYSKVLIIINKNELPYSGNINSISFKKISNNYYYPNNNASFKIYARLIDTIPPWYNNLYDYYFQNSLNRIKVYENNQFGIDTSLGWVTYNFCDTFTFDSAKSGIVFLCDYYRPDYLTQNSSIGSSAIYWATGLDSNGYYYPRGISNYASGNPQPTNANKQNRPIMKVSFGPFIKLPNDTTLCYDDTLNLEAFVDTSKFHLVWWNKLNQTSTLSYTRFLSVTEPGTYIASIYDSNFNLSKDTINIQYYNPVNVSIDSIPISLCSPNNIINLSATPQNGTFSGIGIYGNQFYANSLQPGNYQIIYTYIDIHGCFNRDTANTTISSKPNPQIIGLQSSYCQNSTNSSLLFLPTGGTISGLGMIGNLFNPNLATIGNNTIFYSISDTNGCLGIDSATTIVHESPNVSIVINDSIFCSNEPPINITTNPPGGILSGPGITNNSFNPVNAGTGNHIIIYQFTDTNGCSNSTTKSVKVYPFTNTNLWVSTNQICQNDSPLVLYPSPNGGIFNNTAAINNRFHPMIAGPGQHTLNYKYISTNGCANVDTADFTVNSLPVANAGPDKSINCLTQTTQIGKAPNPFFTYQWTPINSLSSANISNPTASPTLTTQYILKVTDTATTCSNYDTVIVTVLGGPNLIVSNDTTICEGETLILHASGGSSYIWNNSSTSSTLLVNPFYTTTYTVTATTNGCSDADTIIVIVNPKPNIFLGNDTVLCKENSIILDAGTGFYSYLWNTNDTTQNIFVDSLKGTGYYIATITDINFCSNSDSIYIEFIDCSGISKSDNSNIKLFPNPTKDYINIEFANENNCEIIYNIFNSEMKLLKSESLSIRSKHFVHKLFLGNYPQGSYYLELIINNEKLLYKIFLIK